MGDFTSPIYPPDSLCHRINLPVYQEDPEYAYLRNSTCPVTSNMVAFLNLTDSKAYFQAYCTNPPLDDSCSFGYCPNPDVAGPLVRIASYITNICLSILIFYSPGSATEAFWSQVITIYSFLLTCILSIKLKTITRYHALLAVTLGFSPLSLFLVIYAIISFFYKKHRLNMLIGDKHNTNRFLLILAGVMWLGALIYSIMPAHYHHFAQYSCEEVEGPKGIILLAPFILARTGPFFGVLIALPMVLVSVSWVVALLLQRKTIWPPGQKFSPHFARAWSVVGRNYSFIHFMSLVCVPNIYWICLIEVITTLIGADEEFSLSFGQVLAMFVAVPPMIGVMRLVPMLRIWFINLSWVKRIRRSRRNRHRRVTVGSFSSQVNLTINAAPMEGNDSNADVEDSWKLEEDIEKGIRTSSYSVESETSNRRVASPASGKHEYAEDSSRNRDS
ncbi:hypothetical protein K474DRAFT_1657161 [Panus rudis PR-1116 ss-1]|nr:hypothetical protein K474DRAFT_1657161 [Panus rudis PR-1116 ss-1]